MKKEITAKYESAHEITIVYKETVYGYVYQNLDFHTSYFTPCKNIKEARREVKEGMAHADRHYYNHNYYVDCKIQRRCITYKKDYEKHRQRINSRAIWEMDIYNKIYNLPKEIEVLAVGLFYNWEGKQRVLYVYDGEQYLFYFPKDKPEFYKADNFGFEKGDHFRWRHFTIRPCFESYDELEAWLRDDDEALLF